MHPPNMIAGIAGLEMGLSVHAAPIALDFMPQQMKIQTQSDDWTGQSNQAERRRRQNRLNQRAYRKRKEGQIQNSPTETLDLQTCPSALCKFNTLASQKHMLRVEYDSQTGLWQSFSMAIASAEPRISELTQVTAIIKSEYEKSEMTIRQFQKWVSRYHMTGSPTADHVLVLVKFNVFRALINNAVILGIPVEETMEDNALSPFAPKSKFENHLEVSQAFLKFPPGLLPTYLQCEVPHHPWIDLIPIPRMRDNIILAGDCYDEIELCEDMCGLYNSPKSRTGLIIWGDPWDPAGWELTPFFIKKWAWILRGCTELLSSTNYWRAKRGEKLLNFEGFDENIVEIFRT